MFAAAAPASGGATPGVGVALLRDVCARFQEACRRADDAGGAGLPHPLAPLAGKVLAALAGGDVGAAIEVLEQVARLAPPTDVRVRLPLEVLAATCRHAGAPEQLAVDAACVLVGPAWDPCRATGTAVGLAARLRAIAGAPDGLEAPFDGALRGVRDIAAADLRRMMQFGSLERAERGRAGSRRKGESAELARPVPRVGDTWLAIARANRHLTLGQIGQLHVESRERMSNLFGAAPFVTRCAHGWPAVERWRRLQDLGALVGGAIVPVEVPTTSPLDEGDAAPSNYFFVPFDRFLEAVQRVEAEGLEPKLYCAQHRLFEQRAALLDDLDFSSLPVPDGRAAEPPTVWVGPSGTVTPLHHDGDRDNFLVQIVGVKYVRLYPPDAPVPARGGSRSNFADLPDGLPVDLEYRECRLEPGDALHIPARWWHHVQSESVSVSVSLMLPRA